MSLFISNVKYKETADTQNKIYFFLFRSQFAGCLAKIHPDNKCRYRMISIYSSWALFENGKRKKNVFSILALYVYIQIIPILSQCISVNECGSCFDFRLKSFLLSSLLNIPVPSSKNQIIFFFFPSHFFFFVEFPWSGHT